MKDCEVETVEGEKIGAVREVMRTGGTEILVVEGAEKEYLIPFAETICVEVDIENKLIRSIRLKVYWNFDLWSLIFGFT